MNNRIDYNINYKTIEETQLDEILADKEKLKTAIVDMAIFACSDLINAEILNLLNKGTMPERTKVSFEIKHYNFSTEEANKELAELNKHMALIGALINRHNSKDKSASFYETKNIDLMAEPTIYFLNQQYWAMNTCRNHLLSNPDKYIAYKSSYLLPKNE